MPERRSRRLDVVEDFQLDRRVFAIRLETAVDWDRTTYRAVSDLTGVPVRQIHNLVHRKPVLDWAYHAMLVWVSGVEAKMTNAQASRVRRLPTVEREIARHRAIALGDYTLLDSIKDEAP